MTKRVKRGSDEEKIRKGKTKARRKSLASKKNKGIKEQREN